MTIMAWVWKRRIEILVWIGRGLAVGLVLYLLVGYVLTSIRIDKHYSLIAPCSPAELLCQVNLIPPQVGGMAVYTDPLGDAPFTLRQMLEGGSEAWVTHLVARGFYSQNTSRCTSGDHLRAPDYLADQISLMAGSKAIKCYMDFQVRESYVGELEGKIPVLLLRYAYFDQEIEPYLEEGQTVADVVELRRQQFEAGDRRRVRVE